MSQASTSKPKKGESDSVPQNLQQLTRLVIRGFHGDAHAVIVETLMFYECLSEDQLREILKVDMRILRTYLAAMRSDKLVKDRQAVDEQAQAGGRTLKYTYYFIHYRGVVNVLKYKLDHMRRKLNSNESAAARATLYKCTKCPKTYTDLDIGLLYKDGELACVYCSSEVVEDESIVPAAENTRSLVALFNEQMLPLVNLLQECDDVMIPPRLIEPSPPGLHLVDHYKCQQDDEVQRKAKERAQAREQSSSKSRDYSIAARGIDVVENDTTDAKVARKEVPVWMRESTVVTQSDEQQLVTPAAVDAARFSADNLSPTHMAQHIYDTLVAHEGQTAAAINRLSSPRKSEHTGGGSDSESEEHFIHVAGEQISLHEVTPAHIQKMTGEERAEYERVSQAAYQHMYE